MNICTIIGVRPQFVKAAVLSPIIRKEHKEILIHTGQHYDANMSDVFFRELGLPKPDYTLSPTIGKNQERIDNMVRQLIPIIQGEKADAVLSDMAPNTCGIKKIDHMRIINLLEDVYDFSTKILKPGGSLVAKVFQGGATNNLLQNLKQSFTKVRHFKPLSSRKESPEIYLIAQGYKK